MMGRPIKTLDEEFDKYIEAVFPLPIGPRQRQEIKKAFFAGAIVTLNKLVVEPDFEDNDEPPSPEEEARWVEIVEALQEEIRKFVQAQEHFGG